jgi:hypothetical protein
MDVHPQRDQLVAMLLKREADLKAAKHSKGASTPSSLVPFTKPTGERKETSVS